jgi:putative peptidoglycan lipid II flippase
MRAAGLLHRASHLVAHRARAWGVLRTSVPLALGAAIYQINVLVDSFMANNLLPTGGASTYYYANRIQQLPLALVATSATSAVFPA